MYACQHLNVRSRFACNLIVYSSLNMLTMHSFCLGGKKASAGGAAKLHVKGRSRVREESTSESATCKGPASVSTPEKASASKRTSPAKQKLRSPRKVVDKKKVGGGDVCSHNSGRA